MSALPPLDSSDPLWSTPPAWSPPRPAPRSLRTSRFLLRAYEPDDAQRLLDAINADRASLLPWLPWARTDNRTLAECTFNVERFRRAHEDEATSELAFGIFNVTSGDLLGGTGFVRLNRAGHQGEIGYWVRGDRTRQGIATEVTAWMISFGLRRQDQGGLGLRRIIIHCVAENVASRSVPTKLGLRLEVAAKAERWQQGMGYVDILGWGVNLGEWDTENHRIVSAALPEGAAALGR